MSGPVAERINNTISADVDQPADRFWARDDSGDDVQVRLEPDGSVYLSYTRDNRRTIQSCTLTWGEFVERFRPLVDLVISQK